MTENLRRKISQKVPKVRIFPRKISSMENVRNLFVGKCHGKDDISENVRNFRSENVRNLKVEFALEKVKKLENVTIKSRKISEI